MITNNNPPFCSTKFYLVVDKTGYTNYSHIHCIVYLVIGRSSQDSYPFTKFCRCNGSFIHIISGRDTIGYPKFYLVVDKTGYTNYSHIHCIVYLVIGRSSQDSYPFTKFCRCNGSFIHIISGRDTIGYPFSTGM